MSLSHRAEDNAVHKALQQVGVYFFHCNQSLANIPTERDEKEVVRAHNHSQQWVIYLST